MLTFDALFECLILLSACGMNWTGKLSWQSTLFHYVSLASLASNYAGAWDGNFHEKGVAQATVTHSQSECTPVQKLNIKTVAKCALKRMRRACKISQKSITMVGDDQHCGSLASMVRRSIKSRKLGTNTGLYWLLSRHPGLENVAMGIAWNAYKDMSWLTPDSMRKKKNRELSHLTCGNNHLECTTNERYYTQTPQPHQLVWTSRTLLELKCANCIGFATCLRINLLLARSLHHLQTNIFRFWSLNL